MTSDYPDYADFGDFIKKDFTSDYDDYADFRDYIQIVSPVTTLTTPILETS